MTGIASYGGYVPFYRLNREQIGRTWNTSTKPGEKAVAGVDEDSLTLAVEAARDCLTGFDRDIVDGLYFASTTSPYREKQCASIVAAAADLRSDIMTADFANSLRSGTNAMSAALDAIKAGTARNILVVIADCRMPPPNSGLEPIFGDGAAAFLLSDSNVIATVEGRYPICSEFLDMFRTDKDKYVQTWEERFILDEGYQAHVTQAVSAALKKHRLASSDFSKVALYGPNAKSHANTAKLLGFDVKTQVQDPMFDSLGNTGAAFAPMMLVAALEDAKPGGKILLVGYGDGCDVFVLQITANIEKLRDRRGVKRLLASKKLLPSYGKYLVYRDMMEWAADRRVALRTSLPVLWRERRQILRLRGQKCRNCGNVQFPMQRVCMWCQAKDNFEETGFSDKKGTLFTFSMDERANVVDLPNVACAVDLEGGGRFHGQMTDRDPDRIKVGMPMEFTFRKINDAMGIHNYYWKARPVRV